MCPETDVSELDRPIPEVERVSIRDQMIRERERDAVVLVAGRVAVDLA